MIELIYNVAKTGKATRREASSRRYAFSEKCYPIEDCPCEIEPSGSCCHLLREAQRSYRSSPQGQKSSVEMNRFSVLFKRDARIEEVMYSLFLQNDYKGMSFYVLKSEGKTYLKKETID